LDDKLKLIQNSYGEDFFIATPADSLDVMKRFFGVFDKTIYILSLSVVLMSLFVSFALFQSFLRTRLSQLATLKIFGSSNFDLLSYFSVQIVTLSVFASGLCFLILPPLAHSAEVWIRNQGLKTFSWDVSLESVFFAIIGVLLISASFLFPARNEIMKSKIADLFNAPSRDETGGGSFSWRSLLPLILIVFALTVWLTQSLAVSLGVITALGLLAAMALGLKAGLLHMLTRRLTPGPLHLAAINLSKNRFSVTLSFIAISAVSLILQIIPHIKTSLENQLKITRSSELPTLFVFNIPESEMNDLSAFFQANGADARYQSPMIPARLVTINGQEPTERRLKRFPVRLSYRKDLLSSEKLIQSTAASPGVPSLSIEKDFADRSKIKLGDLLEFDILGVKIEGKATSVREVDWLKFHPAFFIQFEPGHLEDAPKTLISSVYTAAGTDAEALLLKTIDKFPTVSVLDIRRTLDRVLGIIESMALSLQMASLLSLSLVALTFLGLLAFSLWNRRYEASVMKALGGHPSDISRVFIYEYLILAALGGLVGFLLSAAAAAALIWGVFDFSLELSWFTSVSVVLSLCLLCAGLATQIARNLVLRGLR